MDEKYIVGRIYMPFKEFRDYYVQDTKDIFRKENLIPLVAYLKEDDGYIYLYFIKEAKSEYLETKKEIKRLFLDILKRLLDVNTTYNTLPVVEIIRENGLYNKEDLKLMNKQIFSAYEKGTIRLINSNIKRILEDIPLLDIFIFISTIFEIKW